MWGLGFGVLGFRGDIKGFGFSEFMGVGMIEAKDPAVQCEFSQNLPTHTSAGQVHVPEYWVLEPPWVRWFKA